MLENVSVKTFDVNGVTLSDGRFLLWNQIQQANVDDSQQAAFEQLLNQLGTPLMRIVQRMEQRDFADLQSSVDRLQSLLKDETSDAAYLMYAASVQHHLANGDRVSAIEPAMRLLAIRETDVNRFERWDEVTGLTFDTDTGLIKSLTPFWFDRVSLRERGGTLRATATAYEWNSRGATLYLASIAASLEEVDWLHSLLEDSSLQGDSMALWRSLLTLELDFARSNYRSIVELLSVEDLRDGSLPSAISLYLLAISHAHLQSSEEPAADDETRIVPKDTAALLLLQIPASYSEVCPELAAAAIFNVIEHKRGGLKSFPTLERELVERYRHTYYGRKHAVSKETNAGTQPD